MKIDKKEIQDIKILLAETIEKNEQVGCGLRRWVPKISCGQKEILLAAENIEQAMNLLQKAGQLLEERPKYLSKNDIDKIAAKAASLMPEDPRSHYHCAEAFAIAVGEHFFGNVENRIRRMTTGFSGGIGGTHEEMCGALFGGVLIIGAIFGRAWPYESDETCYKKSVLYREEFIKTFGSANCQAIKDTGYGSQGIYPCSIFVEKSVKLFLETLMKD